MLGSLLAEIPALPGDVPRLGTCQGDESRVRNADAPRFDLRGN